MVRGGYARRRVSDRRPRSKGLGVTKKTKTVSLKNQIRSAERMLRRNLSPEVRDVHEKRLNELKKQQELHTRLAVERKIFLRGRKIKFFERRKIERRMRRLEKKQRVSSNQASDAEISEQLFKLKEDLEYVRFFPKGEKYIALFSGNEDDNVVEQRNKLREQVKAKLIAAAASGKDLEETGSEDDGILDLSDDEFFLSASSSDEADADDELTDKGTRDVTSSTSCKLASGMSSDERNQILQNHISTQILMPPPRARVGNSSSSNGRSGPSFRSGGSVYSLAGASGNMSSGSDARKPQRKRRPKKKR